MQRNAEGSMCKVTAFWDGQIHKMRMELLLPSQNRRYAESWRYMDGGMMVCFAGYSSGAAYAERLIFYACSMKLPKLPVISFT